MTVSVLRPAPEDARRIRRAGAACLERHAGAVAWQEKAPVPLALVWLPRDWAAAPEQADLRARLLPPRLVESLEFARAESRARFLRACHSVSDRLALYAAFDALMTRLFPHPPAPPLAPGVAHTPLGQPYPRLPAGLAAWAQAQGVTEGDLHVSFTHDGGAHVALLACAPGLRGLGVDVVHLPRLQGGGRDGGYLRRFARRFMAEDEYRLFAQEAAGEPPEALRRRVAAHFSLMESASKALGTGLRLGGGIGHAHSLPPSALRVVGLEPAVAFRLGPEAAARCAALGARDLAGYRGADDEYLLSAVLLWRARHE